VVIEFREKMRKSYSVTDVCQSFDEQREAAKYKLSAVDNALDDVECVWTQYVVRSAPHCMLPDSILLEYWMK